MCPRSNSSELSTSLSEDPPDVPTMLVQGGPLAAFMGVAADAGPRELLRAATSGITALLGERGSCILLEGQPRVVLALHEPSLHDLPIDRHPLGLAIARHDPKHHVE